MYTVLKNNNIFQGTNKTLSLSLHQLDLSKSHFNRVTNCLTFCASYHCYTSNHIGICCISYSGWNRSYL